MTFRRHDTTPRRPLAIAALTVCALTMASCGNDEYGSYEDEGAVATTRYEATDAEPVFDDTALFEDEPNDRPHIVVAGTPRERGRQEGSDLTEEGTRPVADRMASEELGGDDAVRVSIRNESGREIRVGETIHYTIVVENTSDSPVHGVTVRNYLPQDMELAGHSSQDQSIVALRSQNGPDSPDSRAVPAAYRSSRDSIGSGPQNGDNGASNDGSQRSLQEASSPQRSGSQQEGSAQKQSGSQPSGMQQSPPEELSWHVGQLAAGEAQEIRVRGVARSEGEMQMCVSVSYDPAMCVTFVAVEPELSLELSIESDEAYLCDEIPARFLVTNEGSGETEPITVEAQLPEGLSTMEGGRSVSLRFEPLGPGETAEEVVALQATGSGEFSTRATASTQSLEVQSNEASVRVLEPSLALRVDAPGEQYIDRIATIAVTVENTSDDPAIETVVAWDPPQNAQRFSVSSGEIEHNGNEFRIGRLEGGESRRFEISFEGTEPGTINSTFVAEAYCAEPAQKSVEMKVKGIEAVRLEAYDLTDPVPVGETTTYEIKVQNQGSAKSVNVILTAELPEQLEFVSAEGDTPVQSDGRGLTFGRIAELPPGDVATWRVLVRASEAGKVRMRVELQTDATKSPVFEVEPTTLY